MSQLTAFQQKKPEPLDYIKNILWIVYVENEVMKYGRSVDRIKSDAKEILGKYKKLNINNLNDVIDSEYEVMQRSWHLMEESTNTLINHHFTTDLRFTKKLFKAVVFNIANIFNECLRGEEDAVWVLIERFAHQKISACRQALNGANQLVLSVGNVNQQRFFNQSEVAGVDAENTVTKNLDVGFSKTKIAMV